MPLRIESVSQPSETSWVHEFQIPDLKLSADIAFNYALQNKWLTGTDLKQCQDLYRPFGKPPYAYYGIGWNWRTIKSDLSYPQIFIGSKLEYASVSKSPIILYQQYSSENSFDFTVNVDFYTASAYLQGQPIDLFNQISLPRYRFAMRQYDAPPGLRLLNLSFGFSESLSDWHNIFSAEITNLNNIHQSITSIMPSEVKNNQVIDYMEQLGFVPMVLLNLNAITFPRFINQLMTQFNPHHTQFPRNFEESGLFFRNLIKSLH